MPVVLDERPVKRFDVAAVGNDVAVTARQAWHRVGGEEPLRSYAIPHAIAGVGDAFVTVSLAGSLFFNISANASRNQILLYLAVTMAPFALLAPLVGPAIDRFHGAHRGLASLTYLLRAGAAIGLAFTLYELTFYVLALVLLVGNRASGVVRQALVPRLVDDPTRLVAANSRLALLGTIAASIGGIAAVSLAFIGAPQLLVVAATLFLLATVAVWRLPRTLLPTRSIPVVEYVELHTPSIVVASGGLVALRAGVGFFVFMLAFTLRRQSEPAWVYGLAVASYGVGSLVGHVIAPMLRRRVNEQMSMAAALGAAALMCAIGTLGVNRASLTGLAFVLGLSASVGRHAFDSLLQRSAPDALRGQAFARYETAFQLAWVLGALLATAAALPVWLAMVLLSVLFVTSALLYYRASRTAIRFERPRGHAPLEAATSRLADAVSWLSAGHPRYALVEAVSAIDLARLAGAPAPPTGSLERLDGLRRLAVESAEPITDEDVAEAIRVARSVLDVTPAQSNGPSSDPPSAST
jgi:MFS family permease